MSMNLTHQPQPLFKPHLGILNKQKEYAILESEVPEGAHYYEGHAEFGHAFVDAAPNAIVSDTLILRDNEIELK